MKRLIDVWVVVALSIGLCGEAMAQGTVSFANVGEDFHHPVFGPGSELLGPGWFAQLQFADGTNIGDPAEFLANGFFSDGTRVVPGFDAGESVDMRVAILDSSLKQVGASSVFALILGGGGDPPSPPSSFDRPQQYCPPNCGEGPFFFTGSTVFVPSQPKIITYRIIEGGLELQWPSEYRLVRSRALVGAPKIIVHGTSTADGAHRRKVSTLGQHYFFWLE